MLPIEIPIQEALFQSTPLTIVENYLRCFTPEGAQVRTVPEYVLEALAQRFIAFMNAEARSLDQAFGGAVARQRNRLREAESDWQAIWTYQGHFEKIKSVPRRERDRGTPSA